jgi:hypothetical protein
MAPLPPLPLPLPSQSGAAARGSWSETPRPLPEIDWTQLSPPSFEPAAETSAASRAREPEPSSEASPFEPPPIRLQGAGKPPSAPADDEDAMSAELIERTRRELAEAVATRRPRAEQHEVGRDLDLARADYAFESESHDSRWPLFLVVALLLAIIGFVSWALWGRSAQRSGPRVVAEAPQKPGSDASHAPSDAEASAPHPPATSPTPGNVGPPASSPNPSPAQNLPAQGPATQNPNPQKPATPTQDRATQNPATQSPGTQAPASGTNPKTANPSPDDRAAANARPQTSPSTSAPSTSAPSTSPPTSPPPSSTTPPRGTETPASGSETPARPSETPPVTSPSAPANVAGNVYAVHVASYKTMKQAQKEIDTLQKYGYPGRAIQTDLGSKGVWFRVYAGSYATAAEADAAREKLLALPEYDFAQVRRLPRE